MQPAIKKKIIDATYKELPMTGLVKREHVEMIIEHTIDTLEPAMKAKDSLVSIGWAAFIIALMFNFA